MFQMDLHQKNETVVNALYHLDKGIELMRKTKEHIGCFIVGYGSTGGSHKIKSAVLEALKEKRLKHQIKGYLLGSDIDLFNPNYLSLRPQDRLQIDEATRRRKNPGEVLVFI